jgi:hypothetical protein
LKIKTNHSEWKTTIKRWIQKITNSKSARGSILVSSINNTQRSRKSSFPNLEFKTRWRNKCRIYEKMRESKENRMSRDPKKGFDLAPLLTVLGSTILRDRPVKQISSECFYIFFKVRKGTRRSEKPKYENEKPKREAEVEWSMEKSREMAIRRRRRWQSDI